MIFALLVMGAAFFWLMAETRWLTIRLPMGAGAMTGMVLGLVASMIAGDLVSGKKVTGNILVRECLPIMVSVLVVSQILRYALGQEVPVGGKG